MGEGYLCDCKELMGFCTGLFQNYGFSHEHATEISKCLVETDMRGIRSHGTVRVEMYLTQLEKGAINAKGQPKVVKETKTTAVIDGDKAAGAPVCEMAVRIAREKAAEYGMGMVTARASNHFGPAGHWSIKLAGEDMIGFAAANNPPMVAAPESTKAVIGNNPFSLAVPAGNGQCMCMDISNGMMAYGKIHEYKRLNKPFPENCWLDDKGQPTTDPFAAEFLKFISLPFGMHKGFCLAVMVEAITSMLSGGPVADEFAPPGADLDANNPNSQCFMAIKLDNFLDPSEYTETVAKFKKYLRSVPVRKEGSVIYYPGEIENIAWAKALAEGIIIPKNVKEYLGSAAGKAGLTVPAGLFKEI